MQNKFWYGSLFPIVYIYTVWFQFLHRINAAFGISPKFVPYKTDTTKPWALLKSGDDLNDIVSVMTAKNVYVMFAAGDVGVSNKPATGIFMVRTTNLGGGTAVQEVTMLTGDDRGKSYVRTFINSSDWSAWKQTTNV